MLLHSPWHLLLRHSSKTSSPACRVIRSAAYLRDRNAETQPFGPVRYANLMPSFGHCSKTLHGLEIIELKATDNA